MIQEITLTPIQISDLFFNSTLDNYKDYCSGEGDSDADAEREAVGKDAAEFAGTIGRAQDAEFITDLTDDFLQRR